MNELTIPDFDTAEMEALRKRAAQNGRTINEEALEILRSALGADPPSCLGRLEERPNE